MKTIIAICLLFSSAHAGAALGRATVELNPIPMPGVEGVAPIPGAA